MKRPKYILGVDLGQAADFTALCLLERQPVFTGRYVDEVRDRHLISVQETTDHFAARLVERLPLHTSYTAIAERVKAIRANAPNEMEVVIDKTGVGAPFSDMLRSLDVRHTSIVITGGRKVTADENGYHVPKLDLIDAVRTLLEHRRLKIAGSIPHAKILDEELRTFTAKKRANGATSYEAWRDREHDDLVLALALTAWRGLGTAERIKDIQEGPKPGSKVWCDNETRMMRERAERRLRGGDDD